MPFEAPSDLAIRGAERRGQAIQGPGRGEIVQLQPPREVLQQYGTTHRIGRAFDRLARLRLQAREAADRFEDDPQRRFESALELRQAGPVARLQGQLERLGYLAKLGRAQCSGCPRIECANRAARSESPDSTASTNSRGVAS